MGRKRVVDENEETFQTSLKRWLVDKNKSDWDIMWNCMQFAVSNITKKQLMGIPQQDDFDELVTDITIYCMDRIKNHNAVPNKLSSWCWLRCTLFILDKNRQWRQRFVRTFADYDENTEKAIMRRIDDNVTLSQMYVNLMQDIVHKGRITFAELLDKMSELHELGYSEDEVLQFVYDKYGEVK